MVAYELAYSFEWDSNEGNSRTNIFSGEMKYGLGNTIRTQ